jgi:hypothetical protein
MRRYASAGKGAKTGMGEGSACFRFGIVRVIGRSVLSHLSVRRRQGRAEFQILSGNEAMASGFTMEPAWGGK